MNISVLGTKVLAFLHNSSTSFYPHNNSNDYSII